VKVVGPSVEVDVADVADVAESSLSLLDVGVDIEIRSVVKSTASHQFLTDRLTVKVDYFRR
jgi:hypothetical protein